MSSGQASASATLAQQAAANLLHPLSLTLLALTFSTGTVDAVSYLGLGHVFTANMTGNIVLLGFGIARAGGLPVVSPIVSLAAFVVGSGIGGALARRMADRHRAHLSYALGLEVTLLAGAAILAAATDPHQASVAADATIALMAAAMGVRNATARRLAVPDLTTTVLTMTLTGIAADVRAKDHGRAGLGRRVLAVAAMFAGAVGGALLVLHAGTAPALGLATGLLAVVTAGTVLAARRPGPWRAG